MQVIGPNWPSTERLKEALSAVQTDKVLRYGVDAVDALEQLRRLQRAGIRTPEFTTDLEQAKTWVRQGAQVFGRRLHHTQGNDIIGSGRKFDRGGRERWSSKWERRDFWTKVLPVAEEWRQHVAFGKGIRRGKKVQTGPTVRKMPVRSRANGWTLQYGTGVQPPEGLRDLGKRAVEAVGYQMGAVDVIQTTRGELVVLEVNSAPALRDDATLNAYVGAVKKWVQGGR